MRRATLARRFRGGVFCRGGFAGNPLFAQLARALQQRFLLGLVFGHSDGRISLLELTHDCGLGETFFSFDVGHALLTRS